MNILEKILEEIEDHAIEFESFGMCDDYVSVGWAKEIIRSHMEKRKKVSRARIITREIDEKSYYEIEYKEAGKDEYDVGYGSYDLNNVISWFNECFEFCGKTKVASDNDGWIPVEEKLPEEDERYKGRKVIDVLVTTAKGKVTKVQRQSHNGYWWWGRIYGEPTAWQPLPEPYKEG